MQFRKNNRVNQHHQRRGRNRRVHQSDVKVDVVSREKTAVPMISKGDSAVLAHQSIATTGWMSHFQIPASPSLPTNCIQNSSSQIYFDLEPGECSCIEDAWFRFTVTNSGANDLTLAPLAYWVKLLRIEAQKGTGDELIRIRPECVMHYWFSMHSREQRAYLEKVSGFSSVEIPSEGAITFGFSENNVLSAGETRKYYYPLAVFSPLKYRCFDMNHISNDIRFNFEFQNPILENGVGTISLDACELVVRSHFEYGMDEQERLARFRSKIHRYVYLDTELISYNDKRLTANSITKFSLDNFHGKYPFMAMIFKKTTNPQFSDKSDLKYLELGKNFTIDVTNPSGLSQIGEGQAIQEHEVIYPWIEDLSLPWLKGMYIIPFNESCKKSAEGHINGFFQLDGEKSHIEVDFGDAGTRLEYDFDPRTHEPDGSPTVAFAGRIWLEINGIRSEEVVSTSPINEVVEAFDTNPWLRARNVEILALSNITEATVNLAFDNKDSYLQNEIKSIAIGGLMHGVDVGKENNILRYQTGLVVQNGKRGWDTSDQYTTQIFACKFKQLTVTPNGQIFCEEL